MFCESCGAMGESGDLVCLSCGRELAAPPPKAPAAPAPAAEAKPASNEWLPDPVVAPTPDAPAVAPEHPCPIHPDLPVGGTCPRCGKFVCIRCAPKLTEGNAHCSDCLARIESTEPEGIGGWLILPAISIVLTPLASGLVGALALAAGRFFVGLVQLAVTLLAIPVAVAFFGRKKEAPVLMIGFMVIVAIAGVASGQVNLGTAMTVVWIIYFLTSDRVKRTFVK